MDESLFIGSVIVVFLLVCVLLEAVLLRAFKITAFPLALWHSLLVNSSSVLLIYLLWPVVSRMDFDESKMFPLVPILVGTTILVEGLLLKLLHKTQPWSRLFACSLAMNVASYAILMLLLVLL